MSITPIRASWASYKPTVFDLSEVQTHCTQVQFGGGITLDTHGVALNLVGTKRKLYMHQTRPGAYSLYFGCHGGRIEVSTYSFDVIKALPPRTKITQVQPGILYLFDGMKVRLFKGEVENLPPINSELTLPVAGKKLFDIFCSATEDMYSMIGRPSVVSTLSAGTDSVMTTLALREIGADFITVCVGDEGTDFDAIWASNYAKQLGITLELLPLPQYGNDLSDLLVQTIKTIEQSDMSNVMMGMCSTLVRKFAKANGCEYVFHGHFADDIVGNEIITTGGYNKRCRERGVIPESSTWAKERYSDCLKVNPNDSQIDKVSRLGGMSWRTPFYHPDVIEFLLSCPIELFSFSHKKPLYYEALSGRLDNPAWISHHKVGYYTGSGIGKIRRDNPILGDLNMREILKDLKSNL